MDTPAATMIDGSKPFACSEAGCNESFASEDHLFVHGITHHSHLSLAAMSSFPGDQTPTPTRFLKSCEELGLFQEFTRNPFDEEFRKATYQAVSASSEEATEEEELPTYTSSSNAVSAASHGESEVVSQASVDYAVSDILSRSTIPSNSVSAPDLLTTTTTTMSANTVDESMPIGRLLIPITLTLADGQSITVNIPANVTIPNVLSLNGLVPSAGVGSTDSIASITVPNMTMAPMSGSCQNTVELGNIPSVALSPVSMTSNSTNSAGSKYDAKGGVTSVPPITASTREKLKATVQTKKQRAISSSSANACLASDLPFVLPPAGKLPLPHRSSCTVMPVSTSSVPHVQLQAADTSTPSRLNAVSSESTASSDRTKFLERQRAAANRCRQKKKEWVSKLEVKVERMNAVNHRLQEEILALRQEIIQHRTLLLEHSHCPAMTSNALQFLTNTS